MARRLRAAIIAVVIGGVLAGCGGGGNGGGTPGPDDLPPQLAAVPDPCTLVTTEEATAALGKQTKECDLLGQEDFFASARFLSADDNPGSIEVSIASGGRAEYDSLKQEAAGKKEFAEVSGVGDAAFFMRPFVSADLVFLRGPYVVEISVGFVTGPPAQATAVTLAQQAAARIAV